MSHSILVVDDEPGVRFGVREYLAAQGFAVLEAGSCEEARQRFLDERPDAVVLDYRLADGTALGLLPELKRLEPETPLVILTAYGTIDLAVRALKEGADQFLTKPVQLEVLATVLRRLLEHQRNRQQVAAASRPDGQEADPFLGTSPAIRRLRDLAHKVVDCERPLLLLGETGTGKGVLAGWLHQHGPRSREAFVDLNCAGLSRELLESELFGHARGAFSGAAASKPGLFEIAHRGTVFLDEIGDLDLQVQPKLLKVLEERRLRRLGEVRDRLVDLRLIAATHRDLAQLVGEGGFRGDLYFRISTIQLVMPPLRERVEDIPLLARTLLDRIARDLGRPPIRLSRTGAAALAAYPWPGNVRELRNILERAVLLGEDEMLDLTRLRFGLAPAQPLAAAAAIDPVAPATPRDATLLEVERAHIAMVLRQEMGHVGRAAQRLGVPRSSLYQKIRKLGLAPLPLQS